MSWNPNGNNNASARASYDALQSPSQSSPVTATSPDVDAATSRKKRKRSSTDNGDPLDQTESPSSQKPRHQPGVKRACNDCRQQKLRCNVIAGPGDYYKPCDRCIKHKLHCSIDNDFKRLGKRAQHEEMVKELDYAKAKLARFEALGMRLPDDGGQGSNYTSPADGGASTNANPPYLGPSEAAASRSLLDLSQGYRELAPTSYPSITPGTTFKTIRDVSLTEVDIAALYALYFESYHPFMPVLNPDINHEGYFNLHPLLHWAIIAVAARRYDTKPGLLVELQRPLEELLWTTLSLVPQTYHVCKALALLCTWPLPNSSTSTEPTMMLTGIMFQLAMQYGLHRPSHAQDFMRFRVDLREEDIADRLNTWAAVNIVAQMVATGHGQPPLARWAWYTYGLHLNRMKPELHNRCQIEKFNDTVTRTIYTMQRDHIVEVDPAQRGLQIDMYSRELTEMEVTLLSRHTPLQPIETLYLKAAALHLRLAAFFDKPSQPNYLADLRNVYIAACSLLTVAMDLPEQYALYVPRYVEQMILAGAVTLLKLLNSFYASHVDIPVGRTLFSRIVECLRGLSVRSNDLPQRLAEVMAQLWQTSGASQQPIFNGDGAAKAPDESLQLRVRCRSSLSVLYDAIWRWRQQVGLAGRENLEIAVENPTAIATSRNTPQPGAPGVGADASLAPSAGLGGDLGGGDLDLSWDSFGGNAVFDPLSWALDGNLQFPTQPLFGASDNMGFQV